MPVHDDHDDRTRQRVGVWRLTVRRVMVWAAATLMAGGVVIICLIALYPGFVIGKEHPFVPLNGMSCGGTPVHVRCKPDPSNATNYSAWYSCSQPSNTTEPICTPDRSQP